MFARRQWLTAFAGFLVFSSSTLAQVPPPPPASPTLWSFLGIPQGLYKVHGHLVNRRGNLPGMEKKPPLKAIADVANLKSDVPAIKAAAEIKQAEDLKPQKIKAIKYLARIGCGCYDKDEKVTNALAAAMGDCTEEVRLAAVQAIAEAAQSEYCQHCKERSCCNEKIVAQLAKMAYERDDNGCFVEPSERVRQAAVEALGVCCEGRGAPIEQLQQREREIEGAEPNPMPVEGAIPDMAPVPPVADPDSAATGRSTRSGTATRDHARPALLTSSRRAPAMAAPLSYASSAGDGGETSVLARASGLPSSLDTSTAPQTTPAAPVLKQVRGTVQRISYKLKLAQIQLHGQQTLPVGATVEIYHRAPGGAKLSTVLKIINSEPGMASAQVVKTSGTHQLAVGEQIEVWK